MEGDSMSIQEIIAWMDSHPGVWGLGQIIVQAIIPLAVMFVTLIKMRMENDKDRELQKKYYEESGERQLKTERAKVMPFFSLEMEDIVVKCERDIVHWEFVLHNTGNNSAINPYVCIGKDSVAYTDCATNTKYFEEIPFDVSICRVGAGRKIGFHNKVESYKPMSTCFEFKICFKDLFGNEYRQKFRVLYEMSGEIVTVRRRDVSIPELQSVA